MAGAAPTSGKDAARDPPPPPHMTSPRSPSEISGTSRREKNKPEPPEPAGFLRGSQSASSPVFLLTGVPLRRDEVAPVTSPGPLHPGRPAGRQGEDCLFSMPILRHSILQQGTTRKDRRSSVGSGEPGSVLLAPGQGSRLPCCPSPMPPVWGLPHPFTQTPHFGRRCSARIREGATWHLAPGNGSR